MKTMRLFLLIFAAGFVLVLSLSAPAAGAELKTGGEAVEIVDARGRTVNLTLAKPASPIRVTVEGPGTIKLNARQLIDKKNPLTRVPVTVTVLVDGSEAKTLKIQDKAQANAKVKGQDSVNPTPPKTIDVKIPAGTHEIVVKVSSSAVRGAAMSLEYDGKAAAPAVAAAPPPPLEPIPLVPLTPAKKEAPPAPPPAPAPTPAAVAAASPPPWAQPQPVPPPKTEPAPPAVPPPEPKKPEPPPAVAKVPEAPKAAPAPAPEPPKKAPKSDIERARESLGLKPKPAGQETAVKKEVEAPAGKRAWNVAEFAPKVGVFFPLQNGNPGALFGVDAYGYPMRWLGIGLEGGFYWYSRDVAMTSALAGDQGGRFSLQVIPVTVNARFEPYRTKGFAPFGGVGGGMFFTKTTTENDWGARIERSGIAPAWQVFGGVNGKLGFGQLMVTLGYSQGRFTTDNADNVEAGGVAAAAGYQMGF